MRVNVIDHNERSNLQSPTVWLPHSMEDAVEQMRRLGSDACFISGGTLLQIGWENGHHRPEHLISLDAISSLKEVHVLDEKSSLVIGAFTSLAQCRKHPIIKKVFPLMSDAVRLIASPAIRTRGTIGGNIMSGIGDLIPLLLATKADLIFFTHYGEKKINLWEWIKQGERVKDALLTQIVIPAMSESAAKNLFFKKIGRRESFIAAIVTVSGMIVKTDLGIVNEVRLAAGGGENKPILLERTEALLKGKESEKIDWKAVYRTICDEFNPVTDAFVTAEYRKKVAANLIIAELKNGLQSDAIV